MEITRCIPVSVSCNEDDFNYGQFINSISIFPAPPTFTEGDFKATGLRNKDDNEHTRVQDEFAPRYPTYAFNPSAPPAGL